MKKEQGVLHRHEDGREHRHFSAGFTIGGQVIEDHDGTEEHTHGILGSDAGKSGPVVWTERLCAGCGEKVANETVWQDWHVSGLCRLNWYAP